MKIITFTTAACLGVLGFLSMEARGNTVYEDTQICTMSDSIMGWNMTSAGTGAAQTKTRTRSTAPFTDAQILDVRSFIFSDLSTPEVFAISRLAGPYTAPSNGTPQGKRGGYSGLLWKYAGGYDMNFDRGVSTSGQGTPYSDNFYTTPHATNGFVNLYSTYERDFKSTTSTKKRASMKVDYACSSPSALGYALWMPIGPWDMSTVRSKIFPSSSYTVNGNSGLSYNIPPGKVLDFGATIYSDADESGNVTTDYLEHVAIRDRAYPGNPQDRRGKGGRIWLGFGCRQSYGSYEGVCEYGGASDHSYYKVRLWSGNGAISPMHTWYGSGYSSTAANRGWVKIQYTGNKITNKKVPYAMKTRVIATGPWDMGSVYYMADAYQDIPLYELAVHPGRVSNISTTVLSDPNNSNGDVTATNFHRPPSGNVNSTPQGGGLTYIDGANGIIRLHMAGMDHDGFTQGVLSSNFYKASTYCCPVKAYSSTEQNRAYVSVDYVAGDCAEGPTGLEVDAIPSGPKRTGDCSGTSQPFVLKGAGDNRNGKYLADGHTEDALAFFSKTYQNNHNKIIQVRIDGIDGGNQSQAGVTIRESKNKDASHATLTVDVNGNVQLFTRDGTGNANVLQGSSSFSFPVWIRLQQAGSTFYAYAVSSSSSTPPDYYSYTGIGDGFSVESLDGPQSFRTGMVVTNYDYNFYKLTAATMFGYVEN